VLTDKKTFKLKCSTFPLTHYKINILRLLLNDKKFYAIKYPGQNRFSILHKEALTCARQDHSRSQQNIARPGPYHDNAWHYSNREEKYERS